MKKLLHRSKHDVTRLVLITVAAGLLLWLSGQRLPDAALAPLFTSTALVLFICAISHLTRRVLFPKIDLQVMAQKGAEHPLGAALVFTAIVGLLGTLIVVSVMLLR